MSKRRKREFRLAPSLVCYSFESCCHDWRFFSLHRRPYPPFEWSSCFPRTIQLPLPASPCSRLSRPRSTIRQSDFHQVIRSSSLMKLVRPYKPGLNPTALPCSHAIPWQHASGTNPGSISGHSPCRILSFCLPRWRIGSATSITIDFGAILPFTVVPACNLPVYASQWPSPDITQDLVRGCELGFAAASISGDWTTRAFKAQPRTDPDERSLAHPVLISDKWRSKRTAGPHTRPPLGHAQSRSVSGTCQMEKCSPRSAAFPPHSPPTMTCLCSNDSSVLCRSVTPQRRTCGPCGLSLRPPSCDQLRRRHPRGLPVLVHEVSRRVWGLRLRRTEQGLALSPLFMLPSAHLYRVGVRVVSFRSSIAHPAYTPVYASLRPSR